MGAGRCARAGCGRFVRGGAVYCRRHDEAGEAEATADGVDPAGRRFRERVRDGSYRGLTEAGVARVVGLAAAEPGLKDEIGLLRVALARLLEEEADATRFATAVARLVAVAVQAARVQQGLAAVADEEELRTLLRRVVEDAER